MLTHRAPESPMMHGRALGGGELGCVLCRAVS